MTTINESIQLLSTRLPELLWKLSRLYSVIHPKLLPQGLFNNRLEMTPQSCIDEITEDLQVLKRREHDRSASYLAERVKKKIHVLVQLCQLRAKKQLPEQALRFGVQAISTRQQWLQTLQKDITTLNAQQDALTITLTKLQKEQDLQAILSLQTELGEVARRLTLARETFMRGS